MNKYIAKLVRGGESEKNIAEAINKSPESLLKVDEYGIPLVHLLAMAKQTHLAEPHLNASLLEAMWNQPGWTLAHTAAMAGSAVALQKALGKNKRTFYWQDRAGRTPIFVAAQHKHLDQFAVEPAQLMVRDNFQSTPMHAAALNACLYQVAELVTPEMLLMINLNHESVIQLLAETDQPTPPVLQAAIWEAELLTNPSKRNFESVLQHAGIDPKLIFG